VTYSISVMFIVKSLIMKFIVLQVTGFVYCHPKNACTEF
jgi:hypothetical protein